MADGGERGQIHALIFVSNVEHKYVLVTHQSHQGAPQTPDTSVSETQTDTTLHNVLDSNLHVPDCAIM